MSQKWLRFIRLRGRTVQPCVPEPEPVPPRDLIGRLRPRATNPALRGAGVRIRGAHPREARKPRQRVGSVHFHRKTSGFPHLRRNLDSPCPQNPPTKWGSASKLTQVLCGDLGNYTFSINQALLGQQSLLHAYANLGQKRRARSERLRYERGTSASFGSFFHMSATLESFYPAGIVGLTRPRRRLRHALTENGNTLNAWPRRHSGRMGLRLKSGFGRPGTSALQQGRISLRIQRAPKVLPECLLYSSLWELLQP
jgi:hypothetical protein